jgi:hypothetical protein
VRPRMIHGKFGQHGHHSFAAVPGISTVTSICSTEFLFLRSILTR